MIHLDKYGWPVELINGCPVTNFLRILIHGKSVISDREWKCREAQRNSAVDDQCAKGPARGETAQSEGK